MHEVDQHIHSVLKALDDSGQADNTIVIFCPDHGEYGASHGMMMEKWHSAYEEYVHVPLVVRFPEDYSDGPGCVKQIRDVVTSHIDLLPTILGLAGVAPEQWDSMKDDVKEKMNQSVKDKLKQKIDDSPSTPNILDPVGKDLSPLILGQQAAEDILNEREAILFINHDTITEGLSEAEPGTKTAETYEVFKAAVEELRNPGSYIEGATAKDYSLSGELAQNSVVQPSLVNCVMSNDNWKLVRYFELSDSNPNDFTNNNQFELYDLNTDPNEQCNLLVYDATSFPTVINNLPQPLVDAGYDQAKIEGKAKHMLGLLEKLESEMLT